MRDGHSSVFLLCLVSSTSFSIRNLFLMDRLFASLILGSLETVSSSRPSSLVANTENNTTTESHYETKGQGSDQKRYSQLYQQLQSYRPSPHIGGEAPSYRVLPSHTDEIPLSPDQYGYTSTCCFIYCSTISLFNHFLQRKSRHTIGC